MYAWSFYVYIYISHVASYLATCATGIMNSGISFYHTTFSDSDFAELGVKTMRQREMLKKHCRDLENSKQHWCHHSACC